MTTIALFLAWVSMLTAPATLIGGRCSRCILEHKESRVSIGMTACTAMACAGPYYDEKGQWNPAEECNTCRTEMWCSRGHRIRVKDRVQGLMQKGVVR